MIDVLPPGKISTHQFALLFVSDASDIFSVYQVRLCLLAGHDERDTPYLAFVVDCGDTPQVVLSLVPHVILHIGLRECNVSWCLQKSIRKAHCDEMITRPPEASTYQGDAPKRPSHNISAGRFPFPLEQNRAAPAVVYSLAERNDVRAQRQRLCFEECQYLAGFQVGN